MVFLRRCQNDPFFPYAMTPLSFYWISGLDRFLFEHFYLECESWLLWYLQFLLLKQLDWGRGEEEFLFELVPYWDKHGEKRMKLILTDLYAWYCILLLITKRAYFQFKFLFQVTCKKKEEKIICCHLYFFSIPMSDSYSDCNCVDLSSWNLAPMTTMLNV